MPQPLAMTVLPCFRVEKSCGNLEVYLVCGKSKVSSVKTVFFPRLLLCVEVLAESFTGAVQEAIVPHITVNSTFVWSDFRNVSHWLPFQLNFYCQSDVPFSK